MKNKNNIFLHWISIKCFEYNKNIHFFNKIINARNELLRYRSYDNKHSFLYKNSLDQYNYSLCKEPYFLMYLDVKNTYKKQINPITDKVLWTSINIKTLKTDQICNNDIINSENYIFDMDNFITKSPFSWYLTYLNSKSLNINQLNKKCILRILDTVEDYKHQVEVEREFRERVAQYTTPQYIPYEEKISKD